MHHRCRLPFVLVVSLAGVAACSNSGQYVATLDQSETGTLGLGLEIGDENVDGMSFRLQRVSCVDGTPESGAPIEETRSLADIVLPGGIADLKNAPLDADSSHTFADALFTLAEGCYDVTSQPTVAGEPSQNCQPATAKGVEVLAHETKEIFLLNQCTVSGRGAIDVIAAINRNPIIQDLSYPGSKFVQSCGTQTICATGSDADGDPMEFDWKFADTSPPFSGPLVVSDQTNSDGTVTECVEVIPHATGRFDFDVSVFDLVHQGAALVRIEDWLASAGYASPSHDTLAAFFYSSGGATEDCSATPQRGSFVGTLANAAALRDAFDRTHPIEPKNANVMMYEPGSQRGEQFDVLNPTKVTPRRVSFSRTTGSTHVPWNGDLGRALAATFVQTDYTSNWPLPDGREPCVQPAVMIDCCTYTLVEGADGSSGRMTYYDPKDLYLTAADANTGLKEIYAQLPIYLPYTDGDVKLGQGWIYNGDERKAHGSIDYSQSTAAGVDASFRVRAVAPGKVVAKYWDAWHGNVLVLEHTGPSDFKYRSFYFHLRDGKAHDLQMAKTRTVLLGDSNDATRKKYLKFANLSNPSDLNWGTESDAILVNVNDTVDAQEQIAWSGNTGPGGSGAGLNDDGTPTNTTAANNHLHFMVAVMHSVWTKGSWLYVDPYGVYEQQSTGCYDLMDNTNYDRLLAPFYPYFHGVDLGVFNAYLYYYGQMGRSPSTFTVQQTGSGAIAAGAFKSGLSSAWYVYDYLKADDFQNRWDTLVASDFRLTERSVTLDTQNVPRHNGVFRPDSIDNWYSFGKLSLNDEWQTKFDELTGTGYDVADFFAYHEGSTDRVASIFVPGSGNFIHQAGLDSATFKTTTNDHADDGWLPADVNVMELAGGTYLSALYRQTGDSRMVHWGMTATEYQQWMDFYISQGWDLQVVQNYADGTRYAAIWSL